VRWQVRGGSGSEVQHHTMSRDILRHSVTGQEGGAVGDAVVQPEDAAEQRKASSVAGTCSGTAEDVAVQWMPKGMLSGLGETLRNVAGWWWKSPAVRRQAEDGTIVGGSAEDEL